MLEDIPVLYINLDKRTDRKEHIEKQLEGFKNVKRIRAVETPENGYLGCVLSHVFALEEAIQKGYGEVLIVEDDFEWIGKDKFVYPESDFDVCLLECLVKQDEFFSWTYRKVSDAEHTGAYIVKSHFYTILRDNFMESYNNLMRENVRDYYLDIYWKQLQKKYTFITPSEKIGKQMIGYSDIKNKIIERKLYC